MVVSELDTTKSRIIEAAGGVFAQKGFEAATVREICQLAQANLAAINYYFGDKQRLYVEAVKQAHLARTRGNPFPHWDPTTPPDKRLADFIATLLKRMLSDGGPAWHPQLMLREISRPNSACEELVREYIRPDFEVLEGILAELLPGGVSAVTRHMIIFSIVGQCLYYRVARPVVERLISPEEYAGYKPEMLSEHITRWTMAALGLQPPLGSPGGGA